MPKHVFDEVTITGTINGATPADLTIVSGLTASAAEINILDGATLDVNELNLLDGSSTSNSTVSKAAVLNASGELATTAGPGTVPSNSVITSTIGDGVHKRTLLTLSGLSLGNSADNASLGTGGLIYTFPAGVIQVHGAYMSVGVTASQAEHQAQADVEFGLGTVVASGAVSVLGGTATFESILIGDGALTDVNGTATLKSGVPTVSPFVLTIPAAGAHTVYLNVAAAWVDAAAGVSALTATGTVTIDWTQLS